MTKKDRTKIKRPLSMDAASFKYGILIAAEVASDYDKTNSHPYLISDCILGKLNVIKGKPRRNTGRTVHALEAALLQKDELWKRLSQLVKDVEDTWRHGGRCLIGTDEQKPETECECGTDIVEEPLRVLARIRPSSEDRARKPR